MEYLVCEGDCIQSSNEKEGKGQEIYGGAKSHKPICYILM